MFVVTCCIPPGLLGPTVRREGDRGTGEVSPQAQLQQVTDWTEEGGPPLPPGSTGPRVTHQEAQTAGESSVTSVPGSSGSNSTSPLSRPPGAVEAGLKGHFLPTGDWPVPPWPQPPTNPVSPLGPLRPKVRVGPLACLSTPSSAWAQPQGEVPR